MVMEKWTTNVLSGRDAELYSWFLAYQGLGLQEAKALAAEEGRPCRVMYPGSGRTDDSMPQRLNIHLAEDGSLLELWPG
jgi:hypothetical protein